MASGCACALTLPQIQRARWFSLVLGKRGAPAAGRFDHQAASTTGRWGHTGRLDGLYVWRTSCPSIHSHTTGRD